MDRLLPKDVIAKRKFKYLAYGVCVVLCVIGAMVAFSKALSPHLDASRLVIATAETGDVESSLTASGTVVARYEAALTSPVETTILAALHKAGEKIHHGDRILTLNKEFLQISYEKLKDELALKQNKKLQKQIHLKNSRAEQQTEFDIQDLTVQFNTSKRAREERLVKIGASTKESLEQVSLNLELSKKEQEKMRVQIENQRALQEAEIAELDLEIRIQEKNLKQLSRELELADCASEGDGIITWINDKAGTTVHAGEVIARIADLSAYRIECQIAGMHAASIAIDGAVKIKCEDTSIPGIITAVNPAVSNGTVQFTVSIDPRYYGQFRLNQSLEVSVITSTARNVLRIKNGPFYSGFSSQNVFVVTGARALKRPVEFGASGNDHIEIKRGIAPGERVIISEMKAYDTYNELTIDDRTNQ